MNTGRLGQVLRGLVAVGILVYSGWEVARARAELADTDLVFRWTPAVASAIAGGAGLLTLAGVSAAGARAAGLGRPGPGFVRGWFRVWFQGYFYRYVPGKLFLVVERVRLAERLGVPRTASVMLVVWESLLLLAGAGLVGGLGLLALPPTEGVSAPALGAVAAACLVGSIVLWPALGLLARRFPTVAARLPGLALDVSPRAQLALVLGNAVAWTWLGGSFALLARAMAPGGVPDTALLVTWFVASYVGGQVTSVAPAGLGVREALLVAGLGGVVSPPVALAWAVAHRVVLSAVELVLFGCTLAIRLPEPGPPRS